LSSNSAEAEDLDLYMANIRTGIDSSSKTEEDNSVYEKHIGASDMLGNLLITEIPTGINEWT
jgi:hypothetical protein